MKRQRPYEDETLPPRLISEIGAQTTGAYLEAELVGNPETLIREEWRVTGMEYFAPGGERRTESTSWTPLLSILDGMIAARGGWLERRVVATLGPMRVEPVDA